MWILKWSVAFLMVMAALAIGAIFLFPPSTSPRTLSSTTTGTRQKDELIEALEKTNDDLVAALKMITPDVEFDDDKNVVLLDLTNMHITDDGLQRLKKLKQLKTLDLRHTQITDRGMQHLIELTNLELLHVHGSKATGEGLAELKKPLPNCRIEFSIDSLLNAMLNARDDLAAALTHVAGEQEQQNVEVDPEGNVLIVNLRNAAITDASVGYLSGLTQLQLLNLRNARITDAGVEKLKGLTSLQALDLGKVAITDAGMAYVSELTNLTRLELNGASISDGGLKNLAGLTRLRRLSLAREVEPVQGMTPPKSQITDAGMTHLAELSQLKELDLTNSGIGDAGLEQLINLKQLKILHLNGTGVSGEGINKLQQALPSLTVVGPQQRPRRRGRNQAP